jgi:ubiquinone/menaquinone biosynthesis C-methylase UbiE
MTQEEIWINLIKDTTVDDVIKEYNHPAIFQTELVDLIDQEYTYDKKIIEVGCELGVTSLLLNDSFNKTLLDLNPLAIDLTKEAHNNLNKKANFIVGDMFYMPIEDKKFDIVFNAGVIEHFDLNKRIKALKEYSRIMKDGGVMFIAFPNHYSLPYRLAYNIRKLLHKWHYPDEYKMYDLRMEIQSANLVLEERITLSKASLMRWLDFIPPIKKFFQFIDIFYKFEGYLTVLKIEKNCADLEK